MKTNTNDPLDEALRSWEVTTPLPPRFQEEVWQRIVRAESQTSIRWRRAIGEWIETVFRRPALVASYMAVLLTLGLTAGYWRADGKSAHDKSQWRTLYVQSVDPYRMPRN
jgi:hypothetical protein